MSSADVVKSVSRKLKYYFQVKRLEDGFDLSPAECPRLDHPPLRCRPTLQYDGLHDRPLKHYYSPVEVKTVLTQFKSKKSPDDPQLKRQIEKYMKQYSFVPARPKSASSIGTLPQNTTLPGPYYIQERKSRRRLNPHSVGYGVSLPKRKLPHKGSYPVLRTVPQSYTTKGEARRLLNNAAKLISATQTVDLNDKNEETEGKKQRPKSGAPKSFESNQAHYQAERSNRPKSSKCRESSGERSHSIYTYDPQGNKVYLRTENSKDDDEDDSTYGTHASSPSPGYVTIEGDPADDRKVPLWLKKEMKKKEKDPEEKWIRPKSAPQPPKDPRNAKRAKSATKKKKVPTATLR